MGLILFFVAAAHLFYTPFTKVEESFNVQAMHDILYLKHNFSQYDHLEFPGVVPRSFIGPLVISILSSPAVIFFQYLDIQKFWSQYVVRFVLAVLVTTAWDNLSKVIEKKFGLMVSMWYMLITISQFHFMFYMSRPLPNVMALPLVLYAIAFWLQEKTSLFIWFSGAAIIIFRAELVILLGLFLAHDFFMKKINVEKFLKIGFPTGITLLSATVIVDSLFWGRPMWPEGEVLWYNTILNKSSDWGVSPFMWYFYSAIPRAMGTSIFFIPIGLYLEARSRSLGVAAITFVLLYSFLPHKELRFIIYVFPLLNLSVACSCHRMWINRTKSLWQAGLACLAGGHLIINAVFTLFLLIVSGTNYPGGVALSRLHRIAANEINVTVHICNLAAQSGVSRFMQVRPDWRYSKKENINYGDDELNQYTHLLVEAKNKLSTADWSLLTQNFEALEFVDCFSNMGIQYNTLVPIKIKTKPCIGIMKNKYSVFTKRQINTTQHEATLDSWLNNAIIDDTLGNIYSDTKKSDVDHSEIIFESDEEQRVESLFEKYTDQDEDDFQINEDNLDENDEKETIVTSNISNENDEVDDGSNKFFEEYNEIDEIPIENKNEEDQEEEKSEEIVFWLKQKMHEAEEAAENDSEATISTENSEEYESRQYSSNQQKSKEINFQELRNLALGKDSKTAKNKLRAIIEQHYISKGSVIESVEIETDPGKSFPKLNDAEKEKRGSTKASIKYIIKQAKVMEMVEKISKMNLHEICELDKMTAKDCLKKVIDEIDENEKI